MVERGFEESQIADIQKDSPICGTESLRIILSVLAQKVWKHNDRDRDRTRSFVKQH